MTNVGNVAVAVQAASPPKKSESVQTPKGDDDFKKYLEACSQDDEPKPIAEQPEDEDVNKAAEAAAVLLQVAPVQTTAAPIIETAAKTDAETAPAPAPAPVAAAPVEIPAEAKAEAKVESAPAQPAAAPVKAEARAEVSANFAETLKTAEADQTAEAPAPAAPRIETAPAAPARVEAPAAQVVVEEKPAVKAAAVESAVTTPPPAAAENLTAKVAVDLSAAAPENRPAELVNQVNSEIKSMVSSGKNSLHIQIQPENMGRIDVRLVSKSDGMQVVMTTDSAATGKMLENNLNQLQKSLSEAGIQISGLSVNSQGLQGQFTSNFQDQTPQVFHSYPKQTIAAMPVEAINLAYSGQSSGLDFRV